MEENLVHSLLICIFLYIYIYTYVYRFEQIAFPVLAAAGEVADVCVCVFLSFFRQVPVLTWASGCLL